MGNQLKRAWKAFCADIVGDVLTIGFIASAVIALYIGAENIEKIWLWATGEGKVQAVLVAVSVVVLFVLFVRWDRLKHDR